MAKAKKKATRTASKKTALPAGFKPLQGQAGGWDFQKEPLLVGKLVDITETQSAYKDPSTKKFKKQKIAVVRTADGAEVKLYESAGLRPLFSLKKGRQVAITFDGLLKLKGGRKPMKLYTVGVK